jgi:hypothetical protein
MAYLNIANRMGKYSSPERRGTSIKKKKSRIVVSYKQNQKKINRSAPKPNSWIHHFVSYPTDPSQRQLKVRTVVIVGSD